MRVAEWVAVRSSSIKLFTRKTFPGLDNLLVLHDIHNYAPLTNCRRFFEWYAARKVPRFYQVEALIFRFGNVFLRIFAKVINYLIIIR